MFPGLRLRFGLALGVLLVRVFFLGGFCFPALVMRFFASQRRGFAFERPEIVPQTPLPDAATLAMLRRRIRGEIAEVYPRFAASAFAQA